MEIPSHKPIELLLVEDDDAEAAGIVRACTAAGLRGQVTHFTNTSQVLAELHGSFGSALAGRPFLILLDLDLADGSGLAFLDALRADRVWRRSIVFAMSGSADDEHKAAAYDRRIAGYLVKDALGEGYAPLCELLDLYQRSIQFALT